jgi:large-conductance mechanosensitive channel
VFVGPIAVAVVFQADLEFRTSNSVVRSAIGRVMAYLLLELFLLHCLLVHLLILCIIILDNHTQAVENPQHDKQDAHQNEDENLLHSIPDTSKHHSNPHAYLPDLHAHPNSANPSRAKEVQDAVQNPVDDSEKQERSSDVVEQRHEYMLNDTGGCSICRKSEVFLDC